MPTFVLDDSPMLTVPEAARRMRVSRWTIYRWIGTGQIAAWRLGESGPIRIPAAELEILDEL